LKYKIHSGAIASQSVNQSMNRPIRSKKEKQTLA